MASQSGRSTSSGQSSSAASPSPSSTSSSLISQRVSSQTPSSSSLPVSRSPSSSSRIPTTSPTTRPQSISPSFSTNNLPSISISQSTSSQGQIASQAAIANSQATPLSHKPGAIAAIAASIVAVLIIASLVFFLYRRRRIRQMQVGSSISAQHPIMQEYPRDTDAKGWAPTASPNSTTGSAYGSGWPAEDVSGPPWTTPIPLRVDRPPRRSVTSLAGSTKAPHYTVRSHASMTEVYGFGQDVAWKEAHYEDPLPVLRPSQPETSTPLHPEIDITPPTPHSGIILHHDTAPSATLLRSASTASSVSSVYSTASMVVPETSVPPAITVTEEFREDTSHDTVEQGSRRLI